MNHFATIIEQSTLRAMSRCGGLLVALCLLVMPSIVHAQSCGYYVQTKYERQMMQLRHPHQMQQARLLTGDLDTSRLSTGRDRAGLANNGFSQLRGLSAGFDGLHVEMTNNPADSKKGCDGPGCRQKSTPTTPVCSCPVPKHKDQIQGILLSQIEYSSTEKHLLEDRHLFLVLSPVDGLFRPPQ